MNPTEEHIKLSSVEVRVEAPNIGKKHYRFTSNFKIGRDPACDLQIENSFISRLHADVYYSENRWWLKDLNSSNGTFVNGLQVDKIELTGNDRVQLGKNGPVITLHTQGKKFEAVDRTWVQGLTRSDVQDDSVNQYIDHYFTDEDETEPGEHTQMIRRAFKQARKKERRKFLQIIFTVCVFFMVATGVAYHQHAQVKRQKSLAEELFYEMKSFELKLVQLKEALADHPDQTIKNEVKEAEEKQKQMKKRYDTLIEEFDVFRGLGEKERLVLRVVRIFGECEINVPEGFIKEVLIYAEKWKSNTRLIKAVNRSRQKRYADKIAAIMLENDLPPQFYYLALMESDFNVQAIGPSTKFGIAKGMWQFIPSTARAYGLRTGPLVRHRRPDPRDERHDFEKSTHAAARYIRDLYDRFAQASGLLGLASYNWGQGNVKRLISKLPLNPKERNFWVLFRKYRIEIPRQTYDYVFKIISASVIGENPELFGFDFENPFALAEQ